MEEIKRNPKAKKGEPGYFERNTKAAVEGTKNKAIRERGFKDASELKKALDAYFADCDKNGELYDEAGMALYLSQYFNANITLNKLHHWYDGSNCPELMETTQMAYLKIQHQIAVDKRYHEKNMVTRSIFLNKQTRFGGYQDKSEQKSDIAVNIKFGKGMEESDFR